MVNVMKNLLPLLAALAFACGPPDPGDGGDTVDMKQNPDGIGCKADETKCSACVNMQTDPGNCGACGHRCNAGETCQGGQCKTPDTCLSAAQNPDIPKGQAYQACEYLDLVVGYEYTFKDLLRETPARSNASSCQPQIVVNHVTARVPSDSWTCSGKTLYQGCAASPSSTCYVITFETVQGNPAGKMIVSQINVGHDMSQEPNPPRADVPLTWATRTNP